MSIEQVTPAATEETRAPNNVEIQTSPSLEEENQRLKLQLLEEKYKMMMAMKSKEYDEDYSSTESITTRKG